MVFDFKMNKKMVMIGIVILLVILMPPRKKEAAFNIHHNGVVSEGEVYFKEGGSGQGSSLKLTKKASSADFLMGGYHSLAWDFSSPASVPMQTEFNLADWPFGDAFNQLDYAVAPNEPISQSRSEIVIAVFNIYSLYSGGTVTFDWRKEDGSLLHSVDIYIPHPSTQGKEYWSWYSVMSWVGYFPCEINEVGGYYVDILSPWHSQRIYFDAMGTSYIDFVSHKNTYLSEFGELSEFISDGNEWL